MSISSYEPEYLRVAGAVQLGPGGFSSTTPTEIDVLTFVDGDLSGIVPGGYEYFEWIILWKLYLNSTMLLSNPSRYISSLPSYNLGAVDFLNRGYVVDSKFWNYPAQEFEYRVCWLNYYNPDYPASNPLISVEGEVAQLLSIPTSTTNFEQRYAQRASLLLQSAVSEDTTAWINYVAFATSQDESRLITAF